MNGVALLAVRALAGGTLVVVFSLVAEVLSPKAFSGLFSAAPSVAFASLALTVGFESVGKARQDALGMVLGGMAMGVSCLVAAVALPRLKALGATLAAWGAWLLVALGLYWAVFSG